MEINKHDSIWDQRNRMEMKKGPLHEPERDLNAALFQAKSLKSLEKVSGNKLSAGPQEICTRVDGKLVTYITEACLQAGQNKSDELATYFAVSHTNELNKEEQRYFALTEAGYAVDADCPDRLLDITDPLTNVLPHLISTSIEKLERQNAAQFERIEDKKHKRNKVMRTIGVTAGSLAMAGWGVTSCTQNFIIEPREAAQQHRIEYDTQDHTLPGEGVQISNQPLTTMPDKEFAAIPKYGGDDDNLDNPRRIKLDSTSGCADVEMDISSLPGSDLATTVSDTSFYKSEDVSAALYNGKLRVCMPDSQDRMTKRNNTDSGPIEVAVQVKQTEK